MTAFPRTAGSRRRGRRLALSIPAADTFEFLARPWVPQLLFLLREQSVRFSEVKSALPAVSGRVLTDRLRELCAEGLAARAVDPGPPTIITYGLTDSGEGLAALMQQVHDWADTRQAEQARRVTTSGP